MMINELIKLANTLDQSGFKKGANRVDVLINNEEVGPSSRPKAQHLILYPENNKSGSLEDKSAEALINYFDRTGLFSYANSIYKLFSFAGIEDHGQRIGEAAHYREDPFKGWFAGLDRVYLPYGEEDNSRNDKETFLRTEFKDILEWIDKYTAESSSEVSLLDGRMQSGRKIGGKFFLQIMKGRLGDFYNDNHNNINIDKAGFINVFSSLFGKNEGAQSGSWGASTNLMSIVSERDIYSGDDFERISFLDNLSGIISDANIISKDYMASPVRGNIKVKDYGIVITKDPTDVAAMSTGRRWTSCVNLDGGSHSSDVFCEIRAGAFVAYLIESDDTRIERPLARARARRFDSKSGDSIAILEDEVYSDGTEYPGFLEAIQVWINSKQGVLEYGTYHRRGGAWSDTFEKTYDVEKEYPKDLQTLSDIIMKPQENLEEKRDTYVVADELFEEHEEYFSDEGDGDTDTYNDEHNLRIFHLEQGGMSFGDYEKAEEWIKERSDYWQSELLDFIEGNPKLSHEIDTNYEPYSDEEEDEIKESIEKSPWEGRVTSAEGASLMEYVSNKDKRFKIKTDTAEEKIQREVEKISRLFYNKLKEAYLAKNLDKTKFNTDAVKKSIESGREHLSPQQILDNELSLTLGGYAVMFPEFFSKKELEKVFDKNKKNLKDVAFDYSAIEDEGAKEEMRREIMSILESKLEYGNLRLGYEREGNYYGINRGGYGRHHLETRYENRVEGDVIKILNNESPLPNGFSDKIIDLYKTVDRDDEFAENPKEKLKEEGKERMRTELLGLLAAMNAHNPRTIFFYKDILSKIHMSTSNDIGDYTNLVYLIQTISKVGISGEPLVPELERLFKDVDSVDVSDHDILADSDVKKKIHDFKRRIIFAIKAIRSDDNQ